MKVESTQKLSIAEKLKRAADTRAGIYKPHACTHQECKEKETLRPAYIEALRFMNGNSKTYQDRLMMHVERDMNTMSVEKLKQFIKVANFTKHQELLNKGKKLEDY